MIKPPLNQKYTQQKTLDISDPTIDINRIQEKIENFESSVNNTLQNNLFVLQIPLKRGAGTQSTRNRPLYMEKNGAGHCHPDKDQFQDPVFLGIGRSNNVEEGNNVEISTLVHTDQSISEGTFMQMCPECSLIGVGDGVGILR